MNDHEKKQLIDTLVRSAIENTPVDRGGHIWLVYEMHVTAAHIGSASFLLAAGSDGILITEVNDSFDECAISLDRQLWQFKMQRLTKLPNWGLDKTEFERLKTA